MKVAAPRPWTPEALERHRVRCMGLAAAGSVRRNLPLMHVYESAVVRAAARRVAFGIDSPVPEIRVVGAGYRIHVIVETFGVWP